MNVLETILNFLTHLARIIFPRKQRPAAGDCPCPHPLPAPPEPPLPPDAGNGSDPDLHRGDSLALTQETILPPIKPHRRLPETILPPGADWLGLSGYSLMLMGGAGCVYKWFIA